MNTKSIIHYALLFVTLVVAQAVVFNNLTFFNIAIPLVFVYFIASLPVLMRPNLVLTFSFLLGVCIDIFSDTPGMNALACTITGAMRRPMLKSFIQRDEDMGDSEPSMRTMGVGAYIKYVMVMSLIYCTVYFVAEAMTFRYWILMLERIGASTLLTSVMLIAINSIKPKSLQ